MHRTLIVIAATAWLAGCAAAPVEMPAAVDDPANPQAPEAPIGEIAQPLALASPPAASADASAPEPPMQQMNMKDMDMKGMDMKSGLKRAPKENEK